MREILRILLGTMLMGSVLSLFFLSSLPAFRRIATGSNGLPLEKQLNPFLLQSVDGPITPSFFRGKPSFVYFGYIQCGTQCPLARGLMHHIEEKLKPGEVNFLFVQLEPIFPGPHPSRLIDPPPGDPILTAFSGDEKEIKKAADAFGVSSDFNSADTTDHSDIIFFVDAGAVLRRAYPAAETLPEEIVDDYKIYKNRKMRL